VSPEPATRRGLLAGLGAGVAVAVGLATTAAAADTTTATGTGDAPPLTAAQHLQRLVEIELLVLYCYRRVLASPVLSSATRTTLTPFIGQTQQHVTALERKLTARGGQPPPAPASDEAANRDLAGRQVAGRLGELKGELDAVSLLLSLEQVAVGTVFVALLSIADVDLIELSLQITANDAQHMAVLGLLLPPHKPQNAVPYGLSQGIQSR
jgi:Ferritin-like domain